MTSSIPAKGLLTCSVAVHGLLMQDFLVSSRVPFRVWEPRRSRTRRRASRCAGAGGGCAR